MKKFKKHFSDVPSSVQPWECPLGIPASAAVEGLGSEGTRRGRSKIGVKSIVIRTPAPCHALIAPCPLSASNDNLSGSGHCVALLRPGDRCPRSVCDVQNGMRAVTEALAQSLL
jgi:hypothetical protein